LELEKSAPATERRNSTKDLVTQEAKDVADHILQCVHGTRDMKVLDHSTQTWRRPRYADFAILYPNATHAHIFEDALRATSIPCVRAETKGFFTRPEIQDLGSLVTWLTWPADTVALCSVLRSPICGIADKELQDILKVKDSDIVHQLSKTHPKIFQLLKMLQRSHHMKSMSEIIGFLITEHQITTNYLRAFGPVEGPLAAANIMKWFDLVRDSSSEEALATHSWNRSLDDASEEDETGNAYIASNAVSMMTIHKSKGLEFPCVIVTGTGKDWHRPESQWIKDSRPRHEGIWYIGSKSTRPESSQQMRDLIESSEAESRAEKERLLYVALTRASHHLVLTGSKTKDDRSWMDTIIPAAQSLSNAMSYAETDRFISLSRPLIELPRPSKLEKTSIDHTPSIPRSLGLPPALILNASHQAHSGEKTSAIHINPRVPASLGLAYGTLVHKVLELSITNTSWSERRLHDLFRNEVPSNVSDSDCITYLNLAKQDVNQLLSSHVWASLIDSAAQFYCELPMASLHENNLIQCKPDLVICRKNGSWAIVDFKTIPLVETPSKKVCQDLGYVDQIQTYAQTLGKIIHQAHVDSYILFTNPISLVTIDSTSTL
jgi:ATP-dependent exoDNAse (exonuclease V) beta subunit